jgi:hypothetical protein
MFVKVLRIAVHNGSGFAIRWGISTKLHRQEVNFKRLILKFSSNIKMFQANITDRKREHCIPGQCSGIKWTVREKRDFIYMRWAGHVALMGEKRNAYRLLVGKPK